MKPKSSAVIAASIATTALISGCASSGSRLIGRWQSNRPLTISTFPHRKKLSPEKRAFFDNLFGKLTLTYNRRYVHSELPPKGSEQPFRQYARYRILASDADSVTIKIQDASGGEDALKRMHFVGLDRYWIQVGTKGGREYFDRLTR